MTTDAMHDSVTSLTYVQLANAMADSAAEYERRFAAFLDAAKDAAEADDCCHAEAKAAMDGLWLECQAQSAMTGAIAAEFNRRIKDRNYA